MAGIIFESTDRIVLPSPSEGNLTRSTDPKNGNSSENPATGDGLRFIAAAMASSAASPFEKYSGAIKSITWLYKL